MRRRFFGSAGERRRARREFERRFAGVLERTVRESSLLQMEDYTQHGNTSTLLHCIAVSYFSCILAERLRISCHRRELARGALLHDYFLYDWHEKDAGHRWHGFTHARRALLNARRDFELSEREQDIIENHMFPLNIRLPRYRESVLVCLVDKGCSTYEVFSRNPYGELRRKFLLAVVAQRGMGA